MPIYSIYLWLLSDKYNKWFNFISVAYVVSGTSSNFNSDTRLLIEFSKTLVLENVPWLDTELSYHVVTKNQVKALDRLNTSPISLLLRRLKDYKVIHRGVHFGPYNGSQVMYGNNGYPISSETYQRVIFTTC